MKTPGDKIKACRIKAGYSKRALAERAGIDETTIFRYENNQLQHSRQILDKIAIVLNVCPNELYDDYLKFISGDYGISIKNMRTNQNLSLSNFSKLLNVAKPALIKWEGGISIPTRESYIKIMRFKRV
jgi:transcriptional regulator with XRE-family HTH domain